MDVETNEAMPFGYVFAVASRTFCCWEHDHEQRSVDFLKGIEPNYFGSLGAVLTEHLTTDLRQSAAIALRAAYQQGIEALMSFLGAMAQAPACVHGWIAKCATQDLQDVVNRMANGEPLLTQDGRSQVTFDALSERVHRCAWPAESEAGATSARFAKLWHRLAKEFLDENARAEYNSIKHGMRISPGGFTMALGLEEESGTAAPSSAMRPLGGSEFGSTFYRPEPVAQASWHFRARRVSVNWSADNLVTRLGLISLSIANVISALQCELGVDARTMTFHRPAQPTVFDEIWRNEPGIRRIGLDTIVRINPEDELTREELTAMLEQRSDT